MKKNQLGEIATILTLGALVIIGISSLVSSLFLKNTQVLKSKAEGLTCPCIRTEGTPDKYHLEGLGCDGTIQYSDSICLTPYPTLTTSVSTSSTTSSGSTDLVEACKCVNGKSAGDCPVNPCGPIPQKESAPNDNPSCSGNWGGWADRCSGLSAGCASDAGETYTYWCDGTDWRFQYANCVSWCQVDYLKKPPSNKDSLCTNKNTGDFVTDEFEKNGRSLPGGVEKGDDPNVNVPEKFKYVSCDGNVGVWVDIAPFCDQFGQIGWAPGRTSKKSCNPPALNATITPPADSSFYVTVDVNVSGTAKGAVFDTTVNLWSNDCDGDISVIANGVSSGYSPWNRGSNTIGKWIKNPRPGGKITLGFGESGNYSYIGRIDRCPRSKVTVESGVSCNFGISPYGAPWVRGSGCTLTNPDEVQKIELLITPVVKKGQQVTWGPPPAPKISSPGIVYKSKPGTTTTGVDTCFIGNKGYKINDSFCDSQMILGLGKGQKSTCQADGQWLYQMCTNGCERSVCKGDPPPAAPAVRPDVTTSMPATVSTNRCPVGNGASCAFLSCGTGFTEIDRQCINPWDRCCVEDKPEVIAQFPTIAPDTKKITKVIDLPAGDIQQFFKKGDAASKYICDYFGQGQLGIIPDIRNCHPASNITQNGNKLKVTYTAKVNQIQHICRMSSMGGVPIPIDCIPLDRYEKNE